jgi:hypothetical protein
MHGAPKPEVITAGSRKREYSRVGGPMNHCQPDINDENVPSARGIRRRARVIVITVASCEAKSGRFQNPGLSRGPGYSPRIEFLKISDDHVPGRARFDNDRRHGILSHIVIFRASVTRSRRAVVTDITHMRFTLARLAILETCRRAQLRRRSHF